MECKTSEQMTVNEVKTCQIV